MYVEFEKNYGYYKEFFNKYSERLIFGTDRSYLCDESYADWLFNVVTTFLGTDKEVVSFDNKTLKGLGLSQDKIDNIFFANFERRVGKKPKPINKKKLIAYSKDNLMVFTSWFLHNYHQGSLVGCSPWAHRVRHNLVTEQHHHHLKT